MAHDRGMALVNALVIVAALSSLAAGLMLTAETARQRQATGQEVWQAMLYLDAAEPVAAALLAEDARGDGGFDHAAEPWGRPRELEIDRGTLTLTIRDLQGRFNVNRLADPADLAARRQFERLLRGLDLPVALAAGVADHLSPRGPRDVAAYGARALPVLPAGGAVAVIEEIRLAAGMTTEAFARLAPHVAALPPGTPLNVNTASAEVLRAVLPGAAPAVVARLVEERALRPFPTTADFAARTAPLTAGAGDGAPGPVAVASGWFEAVIEARLGETHLVRRLVLERSRATAETRIRHRAALP